MQRVIWIAFLVADVVLLALFAAGYAAKYVHPRHLWWLQLAAIALPYVSAALVVPAAVTLFLGKWKWVGVHLLVGVLIVARFLSLERGGSPAAGGGEGLTVMTYNGKYKERVAALREGRVLEMLGAADRPDLIALQETYVKFVEDDARLYYPPDTTLFLGPFGYATRRPDDLLGDRLYQPILSRYDLEELNLLWLYNDATRESAVSVTRARFRWQGREVALYNVHLRSFNLKPWNEPDQGVGPTSWLDKLRTYRRDFLTRAYHAEQLRRIVDRETLPFIVCGDFNSTPHNWVYRRLTDGLRDAFGAAGRGWGATYHAQYPLFRIDYVLVSSDFVVRSARVDGPAFSDHLPLTVTLAWREE